MTKVVFFDIDGVLSIPKFKLFGEEFKPAFPENEWDEYVNRYTDAYKYCRTPKSIKRFIDCCKEKGVEIKVLTAETTDGGLKNKLMFLSENYDIAKEDVYVVKSSSMKCKRLVEYCKEHRLKHSDVTIVDDTYPVIVEACTLGFEAIHISEFLE